MQILTNILVIPVRHIIKWIFSIKYRKHPSILINDIYYISFRFIIILLI